MREATKWFQAEGDEVRIRITVAPAVVNAASYLPGVTEGTLATLFGTGFLDTPGIHAASGFPLPTQLAGTSLTVNGITAPLLAVIEQNGLGQINFQAPHLPSYSDTLAIVVDNKGKKQSFYVRNGSGHLGVFDVLAHEHG